MMPTKSKKLRLIKVVQKFATLFTLAFSLLGGAAHAEILPDSTWSGVGKQGSGSSWKMDLTIKNGELLIEYPTLRCGGHWEFQKKSGTTYHAIERITSGRSRCMNNGAVEFTLETDSTMRWRFRKGGTRATALLIKTSSNTSWQGQSAEASTASKVDATIPDSLWSGYGKQSSGSRWEMELTIKSGRYLIAYPSLRCAGHWDIQKRAGKTYYGVERITSGKSRCLNGGSVQFNLSGDTVMNWSYEKGGTTATATLSKTASSSTAETAGLESAASTLPSFQVTKDDIEVQIDWDIVSEPKTWDSGGGVVTQVDILSKYRIFLQDTPATNDLRARKEKLYAIITSTYSVGKTNGKKRTKHFRLRGWCDYYYVIFDPQNDYTVTGRAEDNAVIKKSFDGVGGLYGSLGKEEWSAKNLDLNIEVYFAGFSAKETQKAAPRGYDGCWLSDPIRSRWFK